MQTGIPCTIFRGGTSKGPYFRAEDLPADTETRDKVLLAALGSPDERQIDGIGGADPLTSKVAVISKSTRPDADIDYLFLQVVVDKPIVDAGQNCGNILAGVAPFAIEKGLVKVSEPTTQVRIHMVNTKSIAIATIDTPQGIVRYTGHARIDGVPGTHAPVLLDFLDIAGSSCGALLPTGNTSDVIAGIPVTLIDNGMPVIVVRADALGLTGYESIEALEANQDLIHLKEEIRLKAGPLMNLGDVAQRTVPKFSIVAAPRNGGAISTRTFIPHKVHDAIGVLGAVSVATACMMPGSVARDLAVLGAGSEQELEVEHPTGFFTVRMEMGADGIEVKRAAILRTARKIMDGTIYVPKTIWSGN